MAKRLRGKGNDHAVWSDFMVSKFQHHSEEGSYNRLWQILRKLTTALCNGVPTSTKTVNISLHLNHPLVRRTPLHMVLPVPLRKGSQQASRRNEWRVHGILYPPHTVRHLWAYLQYTYCGKMHPPGCALRAHSDAKWKESVTGRHIIRLKGLSATLDIQQWYDGASDKMDVDLRPPCCCNPNGGISEHLISATLRLRPKSMYLLILGVYRQTSLVLRLLICSTAGVKGRSYGIQGIMNLTITLTNNDDNATAHFYEQL